MSTIISFGAPRSGTTFIDAMFLDSPAVLSLREHAFHTPVVGNDESKTWFLEKFGEIWEDNGNDKWYHIKLSESSIFHPMNRQKDFLELCEIVKKPIVVLHTYRSSLNIYKSLLHMKGEINMLPRFVAWTPASVCSMLLDEMISFYWVCSIGYNVINLDFDKFKDTEYVQSEFAKSSLPPVITSCCKDFIEQMYGGCSVRQGRFSDNVGDVEIPEDIQKQFMDVDIILYGLNKLCEVQYAKSYHQ